MEISWDNLKAIFGKSVSKITDNIYILYVNEDKVKELFTIKRDGDQWRIIVSIYEVYTVSSMQEVVYNYGYTLVELTKKKVLSKGLGVYLNTL